MLLGIDTGGTFTDFVLFDGAEVVTYKVLSTPHAPEKAIKQGIEALGLSLEDLHIIHGSTVATNAVLEGKLATTVYITNKGLKDTLSIGRQARRELYNLQPRPQPPPVPPDYCLEVDCRLAADGEILQPLDDEALSSLQQQLEVLQPEAVAINLLFSFVDDTHEKKIAGSLSDALFVTRSSSLLPVYREYERGMATWLNAATGPLMQRYLGELADQVKPATLTVMQSSGDTIGAVQAAETPVNLLLSGPAGGLMGARALAEFAGFSQLMTFDMGGTSSDVALIDGVVQLTDEGEIAGYPISIPMVDMHTIGAGGGSLAWIDQGGLLQVGPQSAGALPGPACYARGGSEATVTDANLVLGHLPEQVTLGGDMSLDIDAAITSVQLIADQLKCSVELAAEGIISLANEHMARALRVISIEKGHDPTDFTLVSFGGAGGLHACDLAESLSMNSLLVPLHAGVLSALGMLAAPRGRRYMRTVMQAFSELEIIFIENVFAEMESTGQQALVSEGLLDQDLIYRRQADVRYIGQSSTIRLDWLALEDMQRDFQQLHARRFGHALKEPLELVNVHVSVQAESVMPDLKEIETQQAVPVGEQAVYGYDQPVPIIERLSMAAGQMINGPVILVEPSATTWVKLGWQLKVDGYGNLVLSRTS
jgi:N-methylhydantoinase A